MQKNNQQKMKLFRYLSFIFLIMTANWCALAQCGSAPVFDFGDDTILCNGASLTLNTAPGFLSYTWSNGQETQNITVNSAGTYSVDAMYVEPNLVLNGDFENGDINFTTDYIPGTGGSWGLLSLEGQYAVSDSPSNVHNNFSFCDDHTPAGTNMLIVNGAGTPNTVVWSQDISISPNTDYIFSCWVSNVLYSFSVANLQFFINGVQLGSVFSTTENPCEWTEFYEIWNSGSATSATISILNQNTSGDGNDFALDDIVFTSICHRQDAITVGVENITANAGPDLNFCAESPVSFSASSNIPNVDFLWSNGVTTDTMLPPSSGIYTLTVTSSNGCSATDEAAATVISMDWDIDQLTQTNTTCGLSNGAIELSTSGTFIGTPTYSWTGPETPVPSTYETANISHLSPGWYHLTINSNGCTRTASTLILPSSPTFADFTPDQITGTAPLLVNFSNNSINAQEYNWRFEADTLFHTLSDTSLAYTYPAPGTYNATLIAIGTDNCIDSVSVTITVTSNFVLYIPNSFTPNGDEVNNTWGAVADGIELSQFSLSVFNRWGELLWKTNNPLDVWDATYHNLPVPEGTYTWKCETTVTETKEQIEKQGFIHILK